MNQIHTEREQRFIDLAAALADDFAKRAAQHDEEESFPFENYEQMRECGYTNLIIPEEFDGLGASLLERIKAQTASSSSAFLGMIPNARIFLYKLLRSIPSASAVREMLPCCAASARRM